VPREEHPKTLLVGAGIVLEDKVKDVVRGCQGSGYTGAPLLAGRQRGLLAGRGVWMETNHVQEP